MMFALNDAVFDPANEILLSGECSDFHYPSTVLPTEPEPLQAGSFRVHTPQGAVYLWLEQYSPLKIIRMDQHAAHPVLAFGALLALRIPSGNHLIQGGEPVPLPLILFLGLMYAMLLTVFLLWLLKLLSRRTTKKSA